ncbi:arginine--tRNA ligase [Candidatus Woesearchaeota archaeon CG10_big_fil_rev_8_21_14_0_10_44_13]|nr:MAG: arginine--tRNA ligase [Candidatus Woesearchaeota archaeon CG10_big_fil_rev_8_21_14_0_10_44_13]
MDFKKDIIKLLKSDLKEIEIDESMLQVPPHPDMGDYSLPCFNFSKQLNKGPSEIAQDLVRKINLKQPIARVQVKGPYLNFFINKAVMAQAVTSEIAKQKAKYGRIEKKKENIMVEYPSPNTNKPLHLGHVRNMLIGDSVSDIFSFLGDKVVRANMNNDRGVHICKSMLAYKKFGKGKKPGKGEKTDHFVGDFYVKFNQEAEKNPELEKEAQEMLQRWEKGDKETVKLWKLMNTWAYEGFEETYEKLGVSFDKYYYESDYYKKGKEIVSKGLKKGIFKKDGNGAIMVELEKYGLPNKILLRADGTSVYMTSDIYLAQLKFKDYKLDKSIYVVGSEQNMHFRQLFRILEILGNKWAGRCYHLSYGMVYLPEGRMKSREGTVVDADDLIDEMVNVAEKEILKRDPKIDKKELKKRAEVIGLGALKFFMLKIDPARDMIYNPEESISFEGETGPYVQYTYARICSIMAKHGKKPNAKADFKLLTEKCEEELVRKLGDFPPAVRQAAEHYRPSVIAVYLIKLCQAFNTFYHEVPVLQAEKEVKEARLALIDAVKQVIANGLDLMGIEYVERM